MTAIASRQHRPAVPAAEQPSWRQALEQRQTAIAIGAILAIGLHLGLQIPPSGSHTLGSISLADWPLVLALALGGFPLVLELLAKLFRAEFGSDLLAGISIVTSIVLGEYLAGTFVVLMLSGGEVLESYAVRSASSVLAALARRMPSLAHRRNAGRVADIALDEVNVHDELVVFPHEICPVDGVVLEGHGAMDEAYLTGEPYVISKGPGAVVLSGAINGDAVLVIQASQRPEDSRYAKIMQVMRESEQQRPQLRRLGDYLGAWYTPVAVVLALVAWWASGDAVRFLAVLVVATPCPLLIAIPVAIIGSISLAARRGVIIKDPAVLEVLDTCRTAIFDKTGTLTYGQPQLTEVVPCPGFTSDEVLSLVASVERYSKHPLAGAILRAAEIEKLVLREADSVQERPGEGLVGTISGRSIQVTGRKQLSARDPTSAANLPAITGGLECVVLVDHRLAALLRFRDEARSDGAPFIQHLGRRHGIRRILLLSGDREEEVRYLADQVGIHEVLASQTPEQKLDIVREETEHCNTLFVGDGINDAPAMTTATVGVAFGRQSDVTAEAAGVVILDTTLKKVDELLHVGRRMRQIALQSAIGGMGVSILAMLVAASGYLPPVAGALTQEIIDVAAVLNALRTAWPPRSLSDY